VGHLLGGRSIQPFLLEHKRKLGDLALGLLFDLTALVTDLRQVETLLGLAG
jgi:hypothetical protein